MAATKIYSELQQLSQILFDMEQRLMAIFDGLTQEVHDAVGVMNSTAALLDGLDKKFDEIKAGLVTADEVQAELKAAKEKLMAAAAANADNLDAPANP